MWRLGPATADLEDQMHVKLPLVSTAPDSHERGSGWNEDRPLLTTRSHPDQLVNAGLFPRNADF